jgi:hypothetical protein
VDKEQKPSDIKSNIALLELTIGQAAVARSYTVTGFAVFCEKKNYQAAGDFKVGQPCSSFVTALRH